ncbi:aldose 1-epimerase family protein [Sphingomonas gilva]|uniref:Aldose 1-epimerase family protein n=1 Tax=Sphingomonas gilva TaxID=2305907 RepID=A0A396RPJ6_9SPHN|nr:aldose 1-epimerase family protein [Sphingomonas gilva]RHW17746.1 aldose 1-epimerase family protein [Sphingomonas gilva]
MPSSLQESARSDWTEISSGALTAAINPLGAELSSLRDAEGRELMTDADPAFWTGRAPLLFPVVGGLVEGRYRLDGVELAMAKHGFARTSMFDLVEAGGSAARFRLTDDAVSAASYPFAFRLDMAFAVEGATLGMAATVANTGDRALPFSFGYHPAFAWPLPYGRGRADHRIVFEEDEPDALRSITPDGLIGDAPRENPVEGRVLRLADDLFTDDALVWDAIRSRRLSYGASDGPRLDIAFPDTPSLGIWTKPGARYICVEPWAGHADPAGFTGDFRDKPGVMQLQPGDTRQFRMNVTLIPA